MSLPLKPMLSWYKDCFLIFSSLFTDFNGDLLLFLLFLNYILSKLGSSIVFSGFLFFFTTPLLYGIKSGARIDLLSFLGLALSI